MPYIPKDRREIYDPMIDGLAIQLNVIGNNDQLSGDMNYVLFRLACKLCHIPSGGVRNYARMAVVLSALSESKAEFRRRKMVPHEVIKIEENGDVSL